MKRNKRILGVLIAAALIIMHLPVSEADAATSASDFQMEESTLVKYQGKDKNVTIPGTVENIGRGAFEENQNIEMVAISNSVENIEPYAFWGCDNLVSIGLGSGLERVGDYAFSNCSSLKQVVIPSNVTAIGVRAFEDCVGLTDIIIPPQTVDIHESAFEGCYNLTIHYEEGSVAEAYAKSFYERQENVPEYEEPQENSPMGVVTSITVIEPSPIPTAEPTAAPAPVQSYSAVNGSELGSTMVVGNSAVVMMKNTGLPVFSGPTDSGVAGGTAQGMLDRKIPKYAVIDGTVVADQAYYQNTLLGDMMLPEGIREIGELSFARSSLTSIVLPEGLEHIGYGAFYHCDELRDVMLPDTVNCVEPKAFSYTMWVQNFLEGESASAADDFLVSGGVLVAYRGNDAEVTIPEGVRVIAGEAFLNHTEIEKVSLPDSLLVVGEGAFEGCSRLGQIVFGGNVEEIKDRAFLGNIMSEVSLPSSVKKAGLQAFGNAAVIYEGAEAEQTYESSAAKLVNSAYRMVSDREEQESGVTVTGLEAVFGVSVGESFRTGETVLSGADRSYILNISLPEDTVRMDAAFKRAFQIGIPDSMLIYNLELTDESGIPLTKLGKQTLSVVLPVPEDLQGQNLGIFMLDGNGQLERVTAEPVNVNGVEAFRFDTDHLSQIGIYGGDD